MINLIRAIDGDGDGGGGGGGGGSQGDPLSPPMDDSGSWLPDDMVENPSLSKFSDAGDLAKSYLELESFQGQSLRIPGDGAGDDDVQNFHSKVLAKVPGLMRTPDMSDDDSVRSIQRQLGAPEDAEGYTVPEFDAKGVDLNTNLMDSFRGMAAKHGLTQKQFEGVLGDFVSMDVDNAVTVQGIADNDAAALKKDWGASYDQRIGQITRFAEKTGAPADLLSVLKSGKFGKGTAQWLHGMMSQMSGSGKEFDIDSNDAILAPKEAQTQITEIMNNKEHPYWDTSKAGHLEAVEKIRKLYQLVEPETGGRKSSTTVGVGGGIEFG